jgi:small subunit ribosomal protein S15
MTSDTLIEKHQLHKSDTGSSQVQILRLSERISHLTEHLKTHRKDFHSTRGLIQMAMKRRKLLKYVKHNDPAKCEEIAKDLHLRKSAY